jgi:2-polyprenyl-6-hydroxyphenyl methylase/3-demethylubiquinone-9 3-methyltransferase
MNGTLNVDHSEIAKFEALAARWWDRRASFARCTRSTRCAPTGSTSTRRSRPRLLDVGCGGGILAEAMALRGAEVTGIDMGEAPLSVARLHQLESGVEVDYRQSTAEELAEERPGALRRRLLPGNARARAGPGGHPRLRRLVRPGGSLSSRPSTATPRPTCSPSSAPSTSCACCPAGTHDYEKFIRPSELAQWLRDAACSSGESMTGLTYNPLTKRYRLARDDVSVNYMVHASKPA